jgi:K+/H+ antiporter YhaU regulatory subunit KhtT
MSEMNTKSNDEILRALQDISEHTRQMNLRMDALVNLQIKNAEVTHRVLGKMLENVSGLVEMCNEATDLSNIENKLDDLSEKLSELKDAVENVEVNNFVE